MPELDELMNEIPEGVLGADEDQPSVPSAADNGAADDEGEDELEQPAGTDINGGAADDADEEDEGAEEDEGGEGGDDKPTDEEDDEDFITSLEDEDEPAAPAKPADDKPAVTDENTYILNGLQKIAVRVLMPGATAEDEPSVKTVEVYGYGDLPREYLGFATPYEAGIFNQQVNAQETRARELQGEFRNNQMKSDMDAYTRKENTAIAEDLTDLRKEGLFPKFKGNPGTKEFNESEGAKEFDKVVAFMNQKNRSYQQAAQNGRAYRHIGFSEAFDMLHGPNPKAADKTEQRGRRAAASRTLTSRGTKSTQRNVSNKPVQNITDLASEFDQFVGNGASR